MKVKLKISTFSERDAILKDEIIHEIHATQHEFHVTFEHRTIACKFAIVSTTLAG